MTIINQRNIKFNLLLLAAASVALVGMSQRSFAQILPYGPPNSIAFQSNRDLNPNASFTEIYVMNPDGSGQTRMTFDPRVDQQPHISPNGNQMVFASSRITDTNPNGVLQIFLTNTDGSYFLDGKPEKQLTFTAIGTFNSWPRWSPNGREIAFHSNPDGGDFDIYTINADGSGLNQVTDYPGLEQFPDWSPDGQQLVMRRDNQLFIIDIDGENAFQLTSTGGVAINQMGSWSPDGKTIAFLSSRDGYGSVFVTDTNGILQTNLTPRPANISAMWNSRAPAWSKNGQYIYFTGVRPEACPSGPPCREQIFVMNADGSGVTQLTFEGSNAVASVR